MNKLLNNSSLIWYLIAVTLVLWLTLLPSKPYPNKWNEPIQLLDSSSRVTDPKIKQELIERGGRELLAIHSEHPYHARIQMLLGYYYFLKGNMDSVIFHTMQSLDKGKGGVVNSMEQPAKDLLANAAVNKGYNLIAKGDTIAAFQLYAKVAKYNPENVNINKNLGWFYSNQNKTEASIYHYYMALKRDKKDPEIMMGLARAYYKQGKIDSVKNYAALALKLNPGNQGAINFMNLTK